MKIYYTDQTGTFFREHKDFLDQRIFRKFDTEEKEWQYADWKMYQDQITEVEEAQALEQLKAYILDDLDSKELQKYIDLLCRNRKTEWHPMKKQANGIYVMGYPEYPEGLLDIFDLLGNDYDYRLEIEEWPKNLLPTDMDIWQIRTALTYIIRANRFCEGIIAHTVDDGTLLKLMLRLEDLLNAYKGKEQHW
jgi:hypothetical protein